MDALKPGLLAWALLLSFFCSSQDALRADSLMLRKIYDEALGNGECYAHLEDLCKQIGHRLSGSPQLDSAIVWGAKVLRSYQPDSLWLQPVMVPRWTRGNHALGGFWLDNRFNKVNITALGGSIGTGTSLEAGIVEVKRLEDLEALSRAEVEGKIVFFNRPMDPLMINTGSAYGGAFDQRSDGASAASRQGAVGTLVRSLTHALDTFPHTGAMGYHADVKPIPAAAISTVDAQRLKDALRAQPDLTFTLELNCTAYEDVQQYNVIAEIKGSAYPDEYIVVGGHLDSWDIGEGAHDDGAGIVQSMEVLRIFRAIGYQPQHSIRVVLFVNEENGNRGGEMYAAQAKAAGEVHYAAVESDAGGFSPRGFSTEANDEQYAQLREWFPLFEAYNIHLLRRGWSGVDIRPLKDDYVMLFGLVPDPQRYFDYHHSQRDVFETVNKRELELGAASLAAWIYMLDSHRLTD